MCPRELLSSLVTDALDTELCLIHFLKHWVNFRNNFLKVYSVSNSLAADWPFLFVVKYLESVMAVTSQVCAHRNMLHCTHKKKREKIVTELCTEIVYLL